MSLFVPLTITIVISFLIRLSSSFFYRFLCTTQKKLNSLALIKNIPILLIMSE